MVTNSLDPALQSLGLSPIEGDFIPMESVFQPPSLVPPEAEQDFQLARGNLQEIIEKGKKAFDELASISTLSQRPSSYETLALLLSTIVDANKDLIDLHLKIKQVAGSEAARTAQGSTTNNLFVGNTADLLKFVKEVKK